MSGLLTARVLVNTYMSSSFFTTHDFSSAASSSEMIILSVNSQVALGSKLQEMSGQLAAHFDNANRLLVAKVQGPFITLLRNNRP